MVRRPISRTAAKVDHPYVSHVDVRVIRFWLDLQGHEEASKVDAVRCEKGRA